MAGMVSQEKSGGNFQLHTGPVTPGLVLILPKLVQKFSGRGLCGYVRVASRVMTTEETERFVLPYVPHEMWFDNGHSTMNRVLCLTGGRPLYETPKQGTASQRRLRRTWV